MARQRRGGFRPPELRGTLGTLLRTTLQQAGVVRDVIANGAREGRSRLDEALSQRKRHDSLVELGEIVLDLIRRGEIDLGELPEVRELVAHLDELDANHPNDHADHADHAGPAAAARDRFDHRRPRSSEPANAGERGAMPKDMEDDGDTVAASTWVPPTRRTAESATAPDRARSKTTTRVWRPLADRAVRPPDEAAAAEPPARAAGPRKGGISFDDEDLADYMHPDDVPPKSPKDGDPSGGGA